jgi:hypothetical protein
MELLVTLPLTMVSTEFSELVRSIMTSELSDVLNRILSFESNTSAVVSSPAANVILCAPGGNAAVAVLHRIVNVVSEDKVQLLRVGRGMGLQHGTRIPAGFDLAMK